jgi:hypothetical protein
LKSSNSLHSTQGDKLTEILAEIIRQRKEGVYDDENERNHDEN